MHHHVRRPGRKQSKAKPRRKKSLQKPNGVISPRARKWAVSTLPSSALILPSIGRSG